jgi:hypothetical protein
MLINRIRLILICWIFCGLLFTGWVSMVSAGNPMKSVNKAREAVEFAEHVEDGIEVGRTADRGKKKVAKAVTGAAVTTVGVKVASKAVKNRAQEAFSEHVEDDIQDHALESARDHGSKAVRKNIRR